MMATTVNGITATSAFGASDGVAGLPPAGRTAATAASATADFAAVLGSLVTDAATSLRKSEAAAVAGIEGRMPTQAIVEAVLTAERSLQTTLAVRDKAVAAYQEISRMTI